MELYSLPLEISYTYGHHMYVRAIDTDPNKVRNFFDKMFPDLSKDLVADSAHGAWHRWAAGHDILVDVPQTIVDKGVGQGLHQFGHIMCTDAFTKAGIPVPGLSQNGLGKLLVDCGISKGFLNITFDGVLSIVAVADGYSDLAAAIANEMHMSVETFFSTFVIGSVDVAIGVSILYGHPYSGMCMITAGIEKVLAGCISTYNTLLASSFDDFLGQSLASAIIGFGLVYFFGGGKYKNRQVDNSIRGGLKSGFISGMNVMVGYFAWGCMLGYAAFCLGNKMSQIESQVISDSTCILLENEIRQAFPDIQLFEEKIL